MGYSRELPSMSGIGYKEACAYLAGDPSTSSGQGLTLTEAAARTKTETHRLARHQNSWFKPSDPRIHWLDGGESAIEGALRLIESELSPEGAAARGR